MKSAASAIPTGGIANFVRADERVRQQSWRDHSLQTPPLHIRQVFYLFCGSQSLRRARATASVRELVEVLLNMELMWNCTVRSLMPRR